MNTMNTHGTYICFGDSNTWGYDPASLTGDPYPAADIWTGILAERTGRTVQNNGYCGKQIPFTRCGLKFMCTLMENWRRQPAPIDLLIMLGTNDLLQNPDFSSNDTGRRMTALLKTLMDTPAYTAGDIRILLIAPPHPAPGSWTQDPRFIREAARLDEVYTNLAAELGIPCLISGALPMAGDGIHLTKEGHRIFAQNLIGQLEQLA